MHEMIVKADSSVNFSGAVHLESARIDVRTNGPHGVVSAAFSHDHSCYELLAALSGEYTVELGRRQLRLREGDSLCLIPPGCRHRICDPEPGSRMLGLRFACKEKPGKEAFTALLPEDALQLTGSELLRDALRLFAGELETPEMVSGLFLDAVLQQIYILLFRHLKKSGLSGKMPERQVRQDWYSRIEAFIGGNYTRPITEEDLARTLGISKRQTSRILRQHCGRSFHQKLEEVRMDKAMQYLIKTDIPVESVALQVGYGSASGFFVAFKKRFSMTPTQYRRAVSADTSGLTGW